MKNPNHAHSVKTHFHQLGFSRRAHPSLPRQTGDEKKPRTYALFLWKKIKRWNRQILHGARNLPGHGTLGSGVARTTEAGTRRKNRLVDQEHGIEKRGPSGRRRSRFRLLFFPHGRTGSRRQSFCGGHFSPDARDRESQDGQQEGHQRRTGSQHDQGHQIAPRFDRLRAYCRCLPRVLYPEKWLSQFSTLFAKKAD